MHKKDTSVYTGLVAAMLLWGLTFVFYKIAFLSFRPVSVILLRLIISVPLLFISGYFLRRLQKVELSDLRWIVLLSFFEPFLYFMGESYGVSYVSSTMASVIVATIPLLVPIAAYLFYREKLSGMNILGLFISFGGVIAVVLSTGEDWSATLKGILFMFMAVISAVAYAVLIKKLIQKYNGLTITAYQNLMGIFLFLPFFLLWDLDTFLSTPLLTDSVLALFFLGIFGSSVTFILFANGVRKLGASRANVFANLIPVFTAIASYFILDESMPVMKILGIVLVLFGLFLSQIRSLRLKKQRPARQIYFPH